MTPYERLAALVAEQKAEIDRLRAKHTVEYLEPLITKAKQAYIDAVMNDNYNGYEEHFFAEYLAKALKA
jgi:ribosomal protein L17